MTIIERLIKFLGGFTKNEYSLIEKEYDNQYEIVSGYRAREESILSLLREESKERKFLQDLILKKSGMIAPEETPQTEEIFQPIRTSPRRWSGLKEALEKDDRERVTGKTQ